MRCPDCDDVKIVSDAGDGVCSLCHGNGIGGFLDEIADVTNPSGRGHIKCPRCGGSGNCPTCGGSGTVPGTSEHDSVSKRQASYYPDADDSETEDTEQQRWSPPSSGGYETTAADAPVPLTESEKRKRLFGRIVLVSAFCTSVAYDYLGGTFGVGPVAYGVFVAILSYVAYRVAYRLKFWLTPLLLLNGFLFYLKIPTTPLWKVLHDIVVSDITNLVGLALIYGIYKFFTS